VAENDEGDSFTRVRGAPRVLVAEGLRGEGNVVAAALHVKGMSVQQESATLVEPSTIYLTNFDAVVLVDVPALDLDAARLDPAHSRLLSYVDDGGGLVVIGGPDSYGVGGYTATALDDVLPVSMRLPQRKDTPSVAVAPIIEDLATQSNVNISKVADEGVINALRHTNARIKHVIVLGDGDAEDSYYEAARASLARGGTGALRAYVQALPDIQQALHGSVPASGLATDLYEDEQQNARETRSHAQIMRDALAKVNWQEIAEALREE
jgi:hypothetical protein